MVDDIQLGGYETLTPNRIYGRRLSGYEIGECGGNANFFLTQLTRFVPPLVVNFIDSLFLNKEKIARERPDLAGILKTYLDGISKGDPTTTLHLVENYVAAPPSNKNRGYIASTNGLMRARSMEEALDMFEKEKAIANWDLLIELREDGSFPQEFVPANCEIHGDFDLAKQYSTRQIPLLFRAFQNRGSVEKLGDFTDSYLEGMMPVILENIQEDMINNRLHNHNMPN